ncbi:hypothetical protein BDR03DRAFT_961911 [Suillus americanus]|nr:hypothetical protein BDR03DRAFT_961911 [Suillus americanus]
MSARKTLATTSENLTVNTWVDWIRSCPYSGAYPSLVHHNVHISDGIDDENHLLPKLLLLIILDTPPSRIKAVFFDSCLF